MTRGEVVVVDWPFSDRTGSKLRPAVVVQGNALNALIDDTVLVAITRTRKQAASTHVLIDPANEPASGLRHVCAASCNNFLTIDQALVHHVLGVLSSGTIRQIDSAIRLALDL